MSLTGPRKRRRTFVSGRKEKEKREKEGDRRTGRRFTLDGSTPRREDRGRTDS